jgi:hypothetical protein
MVPVRDLAFLSCRRNRPGGAACASSLLMFRVNLAGAGQPGRRQTLKPMRSPVCPFNQFWEIPQNLLNPDPVCPIGGIRQLLIGKKQLLCFRHPSIRNWSGWRRPYRRRKKTLTDPIGSPIVHLHTLQGTPFSGQGSTTLNKVSVEVKTSFNLSVVKTTTMAV